MPDDKEKKEEEDKKQESIFIEEFKSRETKEDFQAQLDGLKQETVEVFMRVKGVEDNEARKALTHRFGKFALHRKLLNSVDGSMLNAYSVCAFKMMFKPKVDYDKLNLEDQMLVDGLRWFGGRPTKLFPIAQLGQVFLSVLGNAFIPVAFTVAGWPTELCAASSDLAIKLTVFLMMSLACRANLKTVLKLPALCRVLLVVTQYSKPSCAPLGFLLLSLGVVANLTSAGVMPLMLWCIFVSTTLSIPNIVVNGMALTFLTDVDEMLTSAVDRAFCDSVIQATRDALHKQELDEMRRFKDNLESGASTAQFDWDKNRDKYHDRNVIFAFMALPVCAFYMFCPVASAVCA